MAYAKEVQPKAGPHSRRTLIASICALASVVAASSCCLPLLPFLSAAGAAGGSTVFTRFRPHLLAASAALIVFGFYQTWRARQCDAKPRLINSVLLWLSAGVVVASVLFPQALANLLAG